MNTFVLYIMEHELQGTKARNRETAEVPLTVKSVSNTSSSACCVYNVWFF